MSDERFKLWLQKSKDKHKAICKLCNYAVIDIAVMEVSAFASHAKGAKHQGKVKAFKPIWELFYKTNTSTTTSSASSNNSSVVSSGSSSANQKQELINKLKQGRYLDEFFICHTRWNLMGHENVDVSLHLPFLSQFKWVTQDSVPRSSKSQIV